MAEVTLYDIPSRGRVSCFSHDVWKRQSPTIRLFFPNLRLVSDIDPVRLVLNYKKIPYKTVWLEHKDIEQTLKSMYDHQTPTRLPSNPSLPCSSTPTGQKTYTLPTILLPSGLALSDSLAIARWAEHTHPTPSLYLPCTPHALAAQRVAAATLPLVPILMPRMPRDVLRPESAQDFEAASAERFGMLLDVVEKKKGKEDAWKRAQLGLDSLEELVKGGAFKVEGDGEGGPFILGSRVSYADFVVVAALEGLRRVGKDVFERAVANREGLKRVWESCGEWLKRDD